MGAAEQNKLSTSAMAKTLDIPLQQLFVTLRDCGWIRKVDDGWVLTAKGEFEGGEYVHSKRYGRYIVWPEAMLEHQLLRGIESNRLVNTAQLARKYQIGAREVRRALGDIGLLRRDFNGWHLTRDGEQRGGVAIETDGDSEISWPESLLENAAVTAQLEYVQRMYAELEHGEDDLLADIAELTALDGHTFHSRREWLVANWLYLAGIAYASHRRLPLPQDHSADFWLPHAQIYLEVGGDEKDAGDIAATMERVEIYRRQQWRFIEIRAEHFAHLDEYLTREFAALGTAVL